MEDTIFPFLRYILNVTDDNKEIVEGEKANPHSLKDFINNYNIYLVKLLEIYVIML